MSTLIKGSRHVYEKKSTFSKWADWIVNQRSTRQLLKENGNIKALRKVHRAHLSRYGSATLRVNPMAAIQDCNRAKLFWFGFPQLPKNSSSPRVTEIQMHAIPSIWAYLGLRDDELSKLTMEHVFFFKWEKSLWRSKKYQKQHRTKTSRALKMA